MRYRILLLFALILATARVQAAEIAVNVDHLDFGEVEIGYPVVKIFTVTGYDLSENINLSLEGRHTYFYEVTPETITPEAAANGVMVKVKCLPVSQYNWPVNLVLSSSDADDVVIPLSAELYFPANQFVNNQTERFTANVGQFVTHTGYIRFADVEVPHDPNTPVIRSYGDMIDFGYIIPTDYSLEIEGADSPNFIVRFVKASVIAKICTVAITYAPRSIGSHSATLNVHCAKAGVPTVTINLRGEAESIVGDLSGDGIISITDVVGMIGLLMKADDAPSFSDVNGDGLFNISDVTMMIRYLLQPE
jgi:hypothetical protein